MQDKKSNLVIHVGTPKTGSTHIQHSFASNRESLSRCGIRYHQYESNFSACHWWLFTSLFSDASNYTPAKRHYQDTEKTYEELIKSSQIAIKCLIKELKAYRTVIASAEQFFFLPIEVLLRIRKLVRELKVDVRIVVYVREPISIQTSHLNQQIKNGYSSIEFDETSVVSFNEKDNIQRFVDVFGKDAVNVFCYDSICGGEGVLSHFKAFVGASKVIFERAVSPKNKSLCYEALIAVDLFNRSILSERENKNLIRQDLIFQLEKVKGTPFDLPASFKKNIYSKLNSNITYLNDVWNIEFNDNVKSNEESVGMNSLSVDVYREIVKELLICFESG